MRAQSRSSESEPPPDDLGVRRLITIEDRSSERRTFPIGDAWLREHYGGPFHLLPMPRQYPAVSLVFVQSRDGNTRIDDPGALGGGPTDKLLIYEGLSRVAADAVLAGASTIDKSVFFTVTHPHMVEFRHDLGLPRHPAQIVVSERGNIDLNARVFNTPDAPVFLLAGRDCLVRRGRELRRRSSIKVIPFDQDLPQVFQSLRHDHGIGRISCVGGRRTATALVDAGLVQDLLLTTTAITAGEPDTPWYAGDNPPRLELIVRKRECVANDPIVVEHFVVAKH